MPLLNPDTWVLLVGVSGALVFYGLWLVRRPRPSTPAASFAEVLNARSELEQSLQKRVAALEARVAQHEAELESWRTRYDTLREGKAALEDQVRQLETDKRALAGQLDDWYSSIQMEGAEVQSRVLGRMLPRWPGPKAATERIWPPDALNPLVELFCNSVLADSRELLVAALPKGLQAVVPRSPAARADLANIVWTTASWSAPAMRALLTQAATVLADSQAGADLAAWRTTWDG